jgi:predicted RNase H-like HicB family nuclease
MKLYRLPVTLLAPSEDSGGKYVAEVPLLPGCRAWGDTPSEAMEYIQSVASAFIDSYREHGDPLPEGVEDLAVDSGDEAASEILIAV